MDDNFLDPDQFTQVVSSGYSSLNVSISQGYHVIRHTNASPFIAFLFGYATLEGTGTMVPVWNTTMARYAFHYSAPTMTTRWTTQETRISADIFANSILCINT